MSVPVRCTKCGVLVGEISALGFWGFTMGLNEYRNLSYSIGHDLECNHPEPIWNETIKLFGLVKHIRLEYPETETSSLWEEYTGPSNKFTLWLAIILGNSRGVIVNGKWVWWDFSTGFFGDGVKEIANVRSMSA